MQWLWTWRCAVLSSVLAVILLAAIILSIVYFTHQPDAPTFPEIPDSSLESNFIWKIFLLFENESNFIVIAKFKSVILHFIFILIICILLVKSASFVFHESRALYISKLFTFIHREYPFLVQKLAYALMIKIVKLSVKLKNF